MAGQADTDALVVALGQSVLGDQRFANSDWGALALVIQLDGQESMSGYAYAPSGDWEAAIPASFDVLDHAEALRAAMAAAGKGEWKTCLVQIKRPGPKLTVDFDYEDVDRWAITPANLQQRVEELRPR
ncbi:hypothetical protein [Glacieibacterium frigidum]|uniref:DUF600 family protein n=1 Tax=Glacieibacterium frigidum TaxID=2593303 RepID=A0A552UEZ4_9SPHN|nr:hypothetical protein [Glacieibacterium frigidum]TRW16771.1 hypothetical protein FMM06_00745 [Glacieibacterium frigidum]